jgi:predicted double-glycine peptidase
MLPQDMKPLTLRSWSSARLAGRTPATLTTIPVPIVTQTTDFSCGAAVLLAVLGYWLGADAVPRDEKALWGLLGTNPTQGTNPDAIAGVASALGLSAEVREGLRAKDLAKIVESGATAILAVSAEAGNNPYEGHWVVLVQAGDDGAMVMDPLSGNGYVRTTTSELDKRMLGLSFDGLAKPGIAVVIKR